MFRIAIIITAKGRREHLERSLPLLPLNHVIVVDQQCPQNSGEWAKDKDAHALFDDYGPNFNKPRALNLGANYAKKLGFNYLLFIDADTIVQPGFIDWIQANASQSGFQVVLSDENSKDLTGVLGVSCKNFFAVGGYDTNLHEYGMEDIDLRLRLHFIKKLSIQPILKNLLKTIEHGDDLRVQYHEIKDIYQSATINQNYVCEKLAKELGFPMNKLYITDERENLVKLLGSEPHETPST